MIPTFSKLHQQLCQTQAHSDTILEGFHPNFSKKPGFIRELGEVTFINFVSNHWETNAWMIYKFCQGWEGKPRGEENNPVETVYKGLSLSL